ncbi:hypothetical protein GCM10009610_69860 [Pseudonocardia xinjiangensis]
MLLIANLALGVLFAALTVAFRDNVIDYQLARGSDQTREQLELTVWIRSGIVVVLAAWYVWIARRMVRGRRGAYLRVRSLAVLGVVAVGYLLISGAYPSWMRVLQAAQLTLLVVLVVATNLRPVRESFPRRTRPARPPGNRKAALVLVVLTPVIAEVLLGNVSVAMAWVVLLYIPIYGAGALLIRELVRRAGGGWPSLVAMGIAYGLLEEGLALQSLTSPTLYGAAGWAPRVFGINTAYTELNLPYHVVFSVLIPIALVELLFPGHGTRPYLRTPGIVVTAVVTLLGAALLRLSVPTSIDPGYTIPLPAALAILGLEAVLVVLALRVLPRLQPWRPAPVRPPAPALVGVTIGVAVAGFMGLLFPFGGATRPAFTHGPWVLVPMAVAALLGLGAAQLLLRWSGHGSWTVHHRWAALGGAVLAHSVFGLVANATTPSDRIAVALLIAVTGALFATGARRLRVRPIHLCHRGSGTGVLAPIAVAGPCWRHDQDGPVSPDVLPARDHGLPSDGPRTMTRIRPYRVEVPDQELADLRNRLTGTRWAPEPAGGDKGYGVPVAAVRELATYWLESYDWRGWEARINAHDQFTTTIDGTNVHFVHVRSPEPDAVPLILTHGWPGTLVEYLDVIGPLTDPRAHGLDPTVAFDVVIPSLPGFAFSGPTPDTGWGPRRIARAWAVLMERLGYQQFGAAGNDWGSYISAELAHIAPATMIGAHVTQVWVPPPADDPDWASTLSGRDARTLADFRDLFDNHASYGAVHGQQPQTIAHALSDSPVGLLGWNAQVMGGLNTDILLTHVAIHWLTGTAGSAIRIYAEHSREPARTSPSTVPLAVAQFAGDLGSIRYLAERAHSRIVSWNEYDRGGHYATHDAPDLWLNDLRTFFATLTARPGSDLTTPDFRTPGRTTT